MSILLEALRKSEKSKRAHEVPTIHADDEIETTPETMATGPLALLLVSALFVSGWFVWHQYQSPSSSSSEAQTGAEPAEGSRQVAVDDQSPAAGSSAPAAANEPMAEQQQPPAVRQQSPESGAKDQPAPVSTPVLAGEQPDAPKTTADKSPGQQRTPMESYKPPVRSAPKTRSSEESGTTSRPVTDTADASIDQPVNAAATSQAAVAVAKPKPKPEEPLPIGYWELPDSVRANVPEVKFSVLVYAANPADRFVLINGQRLTEGDNAGPDLVVKEIRREGVIFSYRLYQFLVEK